MKAFISLFAALLGLSLSTAHASGWGDFARGFAETTAATQEQRKCERTYSRAVCEQMEIDKKEKTNKKINCERNSKKSKP